MRKLIFALIILIIAASIFVFLKHAKSTEANIKPEVLNITSSQAVIAWLSKEKYSGRIYYSPAGSEAPPLYVNETFGVSDQHEIALKGLRPSTRYTYWIGDSQTHFQFQTQPATSTPFSFIMIWGDVSGRVVSLLRSEAAEFIIDLKSAAGHQNDLFSDVRPYVAIYNTLGIDSPFLKAVDSKPQPNSDNLWKLDWGGLRLIFVNRASEIAKISDMLDAPAAHTIGILTSLEAISSEPNKISQINESLGQTQFQSILADHNKQHPTRPAAFVMLVGAEEKNIEIDGVRYFGINTLQKVGVVRIDVDVESSRAVFVDDNKEVALKQPPLKQKRTCEECRRLADKGAYEESVKAYLDFIETHKGNYQIDDAYFAIADIYDSKLFDFPKALEWYRRLINEYPGGTFAPLASQRIKYISTYSDHDYVVLANFERIKGIEYARKKDRPQERDKIFNDVSSLINKYPDSNLAPVMQHWLANQYRLSDPNKAVAAYLALRKNYPGHTEAKEAMVEIGETYYDSARYSEAIKAFNQALVEVPVLSETIKSQIERAQRNIRRDKIAYICWGIVALLGVTAFFKKSRRISVGQILLSMTAFVIMGAALTFGGWLIHEQFNSAREMILIVFSFSAITGLAALISMKFASDAKGISSLLGGAAAGILFFLSAIYLAIYYIYVHYLIVVKL